MNSKRRKRFPTIPKRIIITILLIILEFILVFSLSSAFIKSYTWAYPFFILLSICTTIYIVNKRDNQNFRLAWIIFILAVPFAGWLLYLVFGGSRVLPYLKKRHKRIENETLKYLESQGEVLKEFKETDDLGFKQSTFLKNESGFPAYSGTETTFFPSGEEVFEAILKELEKAEKYIFIEFFILADGYMWDSIHKILKEKIKLGVDVRLIFDDFGSFGRLHSSFLKEIRKDGIKVSVFNPITPSSNIFLNNRNHRKIIIIDGKISFTGGFNIADEYINHINRFGHWLDCGIKLKGDAVKSFVIMFCNMWNFTAIKDKLKIENYLAEYKISNTCGFVQPYCDGPLDNHLAGRGAVLQIINSASNYVYIASPYLILDPLLTEAITHAAKSGVDVRIICPKVWDKWYVHPVTQYNYKPLLSAGVKIYEYTPGFIHSKFIVADDKYATIGTFNMDYRSFFFHFECGVFLCRGKTISDIKRHFLETVEKSEEILVKLWDKRPIMLKIKQFILHLFAPFM